MTTTYSWHESYKAAVLETDWTKIQERLQAAELEIQERQRVLSEDHGGTPSEQHSLAEGMASLTALRRDVASWQGRQKVRRSEASGQQSTEKNDSADG